VLGAAARTPVNSYSAGDSIPDLTVQNAEGSNSSLLDELSDGGVIAFLTTTCPYCEQSLPQWHQIHREVVQRGQSFFALSLDSADLTQEFAMSQDVSFPLWTLVTPRDRTILEVGAVPLTVAVMPNGRISKVWRGSLSRAMTDDIMTTVQHGVTNLTGNNLGGPGQ